MSRLLVLYLLLEGARSGYDIKRVLASPHLRFWFEVEDPSIYSALKTLAKNGLAKALTSERATKYRLSAKGAKAFDSALEDAWRSRDPRVFEAALAVCGDLPKKELQRLIDRRLVELQERSDRFRALQAGALSQLLARRTETLLAAELDWLTSEQARLRHD